MKALVVTPYYYPKIGGLENYAHQLNKALQQKGWDIVVATSNHQQAKNVTEAADNIPVHRLKSLFKFSNTPLNPFWLLSMKRIIKSEKPDIIIAHTPVPSLADAAALVAGNTPFVLIYHAATLFKKGSWLFSIAAHIYKLYEQITLMRADKIIAVSAYVKQQFPKRLQTKITVVPNAVDQHDIVERIQPETGDFLFIGSLDKTHAWKGLDHILTALQHVPDSRLRIMGDGNDRPHFETLAASLGIPDRVTFLGSLTGADKDRQFAEAKALVMYPTSANDAFPTVMLEAWARSVPVIAAAIGPIPSLITDEQTGYLVEPNDDTALAAILQHVANSTTAERTHVANTARIQVQQHYTWAQQAEKVQTIAKELV